MRLNKMCAIMALTICELTSTIGGSAMQVKAEEITNKVEGVSWDETTKTLTLNNYNGNGEFGLKDKNIANIVVEGENHIDGIIKSECDLNIMGNGKLEFEDKQFWGSDGGDDEEGVIDVKGNLFINDVNLSVNGLKADNISIKKAKINNKYVLWNEDDCEGEPPIWRYSAFAFAKKITISDSDITFKYKKPTKAQKKESFRGVNCMYASTYDISNSNIQFKGAASALRHVFPLGDKSNNKSKIDNSIKYAKGLLVSKGFCTYEVTNVKKKSIEVKVCDYNNPEESIVKINESIKSNGRKFKVRSIGKNAFNFFKGKIRVRINNKHIKKIEKNAFIGHSKSTIVFILPKSKKNKYTKLIKKAAIKNYVIK